MTAYKKRKCRCDVCKAANLEWGRKNYHKDPDRHRANLKRSRLSNPARTLRHYRKAALKHRYGLEVGEWEEMLCVQDGRCALCGQPFQADKKEPAVDHCHTTGRIRGLLCHACNRALGYYEKRLLPIWGTVNAYLGRE